MIKNIYKSILSKGNLIRQRYISLNNFSTKQAPEKQVLQDWEYVQMISRQIKNNDINQALKYLIQSHLHSQILNKQIYYCLQQKMTEVSALSGYHEILYKLYRQHFQPNPMTLNWMNRISKTQNMKLAQCLKQDYQKLNQQFPLTINEEQISSQKISSNEKQQDEEKTQPSGRKARKVPTIPTTDDYFSKTPEAIYVTKKGNVQKVQQQKPQKSQKPQQTQTLSKQPSKSQIQIETKNQIQQVLQNMFKEYGKVTLHNVELVLQNDLNQNYDMDEEINTIYNQNQNFDFENHEQLEGEGQTMEDYVLQMMATISKIKIGKIELQNPLFIEQAQKQIKNKDDDHKPDN